MVSTGEPEAVKKMQRMFRQHDTAPTGVVSPLYRQLTQEWAALHTLPSTARTIRRWARTEPALAGFARPGDIVDAIDATGNDRKNAILLALIRLFQAGQQLAGRTVLQALLPKLAKTSAHASMCTSSTDTWAEDRRHITIAEFWDVMADYPVDRRTTSVASNLALDTLHRVSGVRRPAEDIPVDPHDFHELGERDTARRTWLAGLSSEGLNPTAELTADADLLQVITWGMITSVITRDEAQLLTTSYLPEQTSGFGFADAAEQLGLTQAAVRQRCSRAARKLTEAVRAEMTIHVTLSPTSDAQIA
ncbi:hypothetical protein [Actinopolymorpha pittospori]|uniref:Uncharacterized protein n=1 Tax=Actinopolymorpha pittospori TaxID=648752 RepID=A0A927RM92_9ACTN|nr:hypothetical protein [Actinopolymorpha pittospori]MBE1609961.1 hypothetical protein [Actinopolymorpha pittospori]